MKVFFFWYCVAGGVLITSLMIWRRLCSVNTDQKTLLERQQCSDLESGNCCEKGLLVLIGLTIFALLWPWVLWRELLPARSRQQPVPAPEFTVPDDFLICEVAVADIELWETVDDPLGAAPRVPFGHLNPAWTAFKAEAGTAGLWRFYGRAVGFLGVEWCYEGYVALKADGTRPYFMTRKGEVASA